MNEFAVHKYLIRAAVVNGGDMIPFPELDHIGGRISAAPFVAIRKTKVQSGPAIQPKAGGAICLDPVIAEKVMEVRFVIGCRKNPGLLCEISSWHRAVC